MTLSEAGLQKKAKKLELQESEKIKFTPDFLSKLDALLHDAYGILHPGPNDYKLRWDLVRIFNLMAEEIHGNANGFPIVEVFGSFTMDMFTAKSDLDLSINFSNDASEFPRDKMISALRKFAKRLFVLQRGGHVLCVQPIMGARVPILKVVDRGTGIECDISVENKDGIARSRILAIISSIDERFQKLSFLMKAWGRAHDINSSKDRTLNSLSIILLVAFHLQTRDPPILPPFSALFKDGIDIRSLENVVQGFQQFGKGNKESLAELFVTLLIKLSSVETLWPRGLCVSTCTGSWICKTWNSEIANMSVQDFTDQSQNTARSVGKTQVKKIYKCIHVTLHRLSSFMRDQIQVPQMKQLLFGPDAMLTPGEAFVNSATMNLKRSLPFSDSNPTKKVHYTKAASSNKFVDWSQFLQNGVDGPNSLNPAALMPYNGLGDIPMGGNHNAGQWGQWPQKGSLYPQLGFEVLRDMGLASSNNQTLEQWPQWSQQTLQHPPTGFEAEHFHMTCQKELQHPPTVLEGKHVANPMLQIIYNRQGPWMRPASPQIPVGFFGSHVPSPMAQMPYGVQGYNFNMEWGPNLYSKGPL